MANSSLRTWQEVVHLDECVLDMWLGPAGRRLPIGRPLGARVASVTTAATYVRSSADVDI